MNLTQEGAAAREWRATLGVLAHTVRREAHILRHEPHALPSHLHNTLVLDEGEDGIAAPLIDAARHALANRRWLRLVNRPRIGSVHRALIRALAAPGSVSSLAWSPDGSLLASGSFADFAVRVWDAGSGAVRWILDGHTGPVLCVAWSPDGSALASAGKDQTARLWTLSTGTTQAVLSGHEDIVGSVAWSPDGARIATASDDRRVRLWDPDTGELTAVLGPGDPGGDDTLFKRDESSGHVDRGSMLFIEGQYEEAEAEFTRAIEAYPFNATVHGNMAVLRIRQGHPERAIPWVERALELNPSVEGGRRTLAVAREMAGNRRPVIDPFLARIAGLASQRPSEKGGHTDFVRAVAWSPDGSVLASAGYDGTVYLWDVPAETVPRVLHCRDHVFGIAWSPDGRRLACGGHDRKVWLWDVKQGKAEAVLEGHTAPVSSVGYSPDGSRLASAASDNTVRIWNLADRTCCGVLEGHSKPVFSIAWSPDGETLGSAGGDGTLRLWHASGEAELPGPGHTRRVWDVSWCPDGTRLASVGDDEPVRLRDPTGEQQATLDGHRGPVFAVAWSPTGHILASAGHDRSVRLWDAATGAPLAIRRDLPQWSGAIAWSPDESRLALAGKQGALHVWVLEPEELQTVNDAAPGFALEWSPNGRLLAAGGLKSLKLYDTEPLRLRRDIELHTDWGKMREALDRGLDPTLDRFHDLPEVETANVEVLAWSPDSQLLASGGEDRLVRLWDAEGTERRVMRGHVLAVEGLDWSPDGSLLASGSRDRTVRVWDVTTGRCICAVHCLASVQGLRFVQQGRVLAVADNGAASGYRPVPYLFQLCNVPVRSPAAKGTSVTATRTDTAPPKAKAPRRQPTRRKKRTPAKRPTKRTPAKRTPPPRPAAPPSLLEVIAATGLKCVPVGRDVLAVPFKGDRAEPVTVQGRTLTGGLCMLSVSLPELPRFGQEKALRNLLRVSFTANYVKAMSLQSGSLLIAAELPTPVVTPAIAEGLIRGLAHLGNVGRKDLGDWRRWERRLLEYRMAQAPHIRLDAQALRTELTAMLEQAGLGVAPGPRGMLATELRLVGTDLTTFLQPSESVISIIVCLGGVRPEGARKKYLAELLRLNRVANVAKIGIDPQGDVTLLYEVPTPIPDLLEHVKTQLEVLLAGVVQLHRQRR